jgi:hypothetical protein
MSEDTALGAGMVKGLRLWRKHLREIAQLYRSPNLVISYPKSGRTWHKVMLCRYISTAFGNAGSPSIESEAVTTAAGLARLSYTHDGAKFSYAIPPQHRINADPFIWRRRRVLLLVRDPRDVLVSAHAHAVHRSKSFSGSLAEFIRHPFTGAEKILVAQKRWHQYRSLARDMLVLKYEDLRRDPEAGLTATLEFLGIPVQSDVVSEAVDFARFENMKKMEASGEFASNAMRTKGSTADAMKVRTGKVGGYADHLAPPDLEFIDRKSAEIGDPLRSLP